MLLSNLSKMYEAGALTIKYDEGDQIASLGGVKVTMEQAAIFIKNIGWVENVLTPFEIIGKTQRFIRSLRQHLIRNDIWNGTNVTFQNMASATYGRTFDRIVLDNRQWSLTIIYNMEHSGGKYVIYVTGQAIPIQKCRNLKAVAEYLNGYGSY